MGKPMNQRSLRRVVFVTWLVFLGAGCDQPSREIQERVAALENENRHLRVENASLSAAQPLFDFFSLSLGSLLGTAGCLFAWWIFTTGESKGQKSSAEEVQRLRILLDELQESFALERGLEAKRVHCKVIPTGGRARQNLLE
jgi:hypothetical protein